MRTASPGTPRNVEICEMRESFPSALIMLGILAGLMSVLGISGIDELVGPSTFKTTSATLAFWR